MINMRDLSFSTLVLSSLNLIATCAGNPIQSSQVQPFVVDLSKGVPRMLNLIKNTRLPDKPEYPGVGGLYGLDLDVLKTLKNQWIHDFDWQKDQSYMNRYNLGMIITSFLTRLQLPPLQNQNRKSGCPLYSRKVQGCECNPTRPLSWVARIVPRISAPGQEPHSKCCATRWHNCLFRRYHPVSSWLWILSSTSLQLDGRRHCPGHELYDGRCVGL